MSAPPELHFAPHERKRSQSRQPPPKPWQQMSAELIGSFLLTVVDAGGAMIATMSGGQVTPAARSAAAGLIVRALIVAISDISGAHISAGVTVAFALRRALPWR